MALQNLRGLAGMVKLARLSKTYERGEAAVAALHEVSHNR